MNPKIKNIIILVVVAIALILVYVFFLKPAPAEPNLTSSGTAVSSTTNVTDQNNSANQDFLSLLLSVKSIKLDDSIFSDSTFSTLHDSSILLTPDGTEGRPNPFAPIGNDIVPITTTGTLTTTGTVSGNGTGILGTVAPSVDSTIVPQDNATNAGNSGTKSNNPPAVTH